jgi:hypothetical protein
MGMTTPGLIAVGEKIYILLDSKPLHINVSTFSEAIGYLLAVYYIFRIKYPEKLKNVFGFFEFVGKVQSEEITMNATIKNFVSTVFPSG